MLVWSCQRTKDWIEGMKWLHWQPIVILYYTEHKGVILCGSEWPTGPKYRLRSTCACEEFIEDKSTEWSTTVDKLLNERSDGNIQLLPGVKV